MYDISVSCINVREVTSDLCEVIKKKKKKCFHPQLSTLLKKNVIPLWKHSYCLFLKSIKCANLNRVHTDKVVIHHFTSDSAVDGHCSLTM